MDLVDDGEIPVYSSDTSNNGIIGYTNREAEFIVSHENPIYLVFGDHTRSLNIVFHSFNVTDNVKVLSLKDSYSIKILLYIISSWQKGVPNLGYSRHWSIAKKVLFKVPVKNGVIDFAFMENFIAELEAERIAELEAERIAELEAYLKVTGLSDYILTEEERAVLEAFRNGKISWGGVKLLNNQQVANIEWKMFRIGELFEINSYKKRFDANKVQIEEVGFPYVVRTALNNGIRGYINEDVEFLNEGNTISFGQDTATMFYQEKPYFTGDKIKIVKCKDESFNKLNAHFFIAAMGKAFSSFSWGSSSFSVEIIKNQNISLPSTQGVPLYAYMEVFIRAVQKLVIKEVVEYADRKIAGTKEIVNY